MMLWVLGVGVNEISSFPNKFFLLFSNYLTSQFKSNCSQAQTDFLARWQGLGEQSSGRSVLLTAVWESTLSIAVPRALLAFHIKFDPQPVITSFHLLMPTAQWVTGRSEERSRVIFLIVRREDSGQSLLKLGEGGSYHQNIMTLK